MVTSPRQGSAQPSASRSAFAGCVAEATRVHLGNFRKRVDHCKLLTDSMLVESESDDPNDGSDVDRRVARYKAQKATLTRAHQ